MTATFTPILIFFAGLVIGGVAVWLLTHSQQSGVVAMVESAKAALTEQSAQSAARERETFLSLAKPLLDPLQADVSRLRDFIQRVETERKESNAEIRTSIEQIARQHRELADATNTMSKQATALVGALKNPTTRGRWGEIQLRRVVEMAGMLQWCDFDEQIATAVDGRPDMTVRLPGNQMVFVDSKAPLAAYLAVLEEQDEARQGNLLKDHAKAVRAHVDALVKRAYHTTDGSVGFTVMFIPGEAFLQSAMREAPDLIEYAADRNVYLCGPLTLLTLLRACAMGWRQQQQEERANEIAKLGAELYDRLRIFVKHFSGIGNALAQAVSRYNDSVGSLESRLLPQGRKIKEAAALDNDALPELQPLEAMARLPMLESGE